MENKLFKCAASIVLGCSFLFVEGCGDSSSVSPTSTPKNSSDLNALQLISGNFIESSQTCTASDSDIQAAGRISGLSLQISNSTVVETTIINACTITATSSITSSSTSSITVGSGSISTSGDCSNIASGIKPGSGGTYPYTYSNGILRFTDVTGKCTAFVKNS